MARAAASEAECPPLRPHTSPGPAGMPLPLIPLPCRGAGSPIHPSWIDGSDSILFYWLDKAAFLWGSASGQGFLISRSEHRPPAACMRCAQLYDALGVQAQATVG